jgi:hypothetical protein
MAFGTVPPVGKSDPLAHLEAEGRLWVIRREANKLSAYYGAPVYLCGSRLKPGADARDWDLRIPLPDKVFCERYNCYEHEPERGVKLWNRAWIGIIEEGEKRPSYVIWRWARDCVHHSRSATKNCSVLVDVQVQPESIFLSQFDPRWHPRVRIDDGPWPEPKHADYGLVDTSQL